MKVHDLRKIIKELPDDTDIVVNDGIESWELYEDTCRMYPATEEHPLCLEITMGQRIDNELGLIHREATQTI